MQDVTVDSTGLDPRRRPKGDKRERTRARLIEAASALIREKGFEQTSLADVAERAGMTTGAIYSNFRNRDELFSAVADVRGAPIMPKMWPGMSFADLMASLAEAVIEAMPQRRAAVRGALAFHAYCLDHEEVRQRRLQTTTRIHEASVALLRAFPEGELPMAPDLLSRSLQCLMDGLILQRIITPELITDEVIRAAFAQFARTR